MITEEEYRQRFRELACCGHVAAVHSDELKRCVSTAGMDPNEYCDCPHYGGSGDILVWKG